MHILHTILDTSKGAYKENLFNDQEHLDIVIIPLFLWPYFFIQGG